MFRFQGLRRSLAEQAAVAGGKAAELPFPMPKEHISDAGLIRLGLTKRAMDSMHIPQLEVADRADPVAFVDVILAIKSDVFH
jgi:hypothetical protein